MRLILIFFLYCSGCAMQTVVCQNLITGKVVDENSGEVLPGANVFLAGTSIGASSNAEGIFTFSGFASGKYNFAVSFVGYSVLQQQITFTGNTKIKLLVKLSPQTQMLQELVVKPNNRDWKENYKVFKEKLLGKTPQAKHCEILNPKDVVLFKDLEAGKLIGYAAAPIQIENKALGYRIKYHLVLFEYAYIKGRLDSYGVPQFEEMKPTSEGERDKWIENRRDVYVGSITHFFNALLHNQLIAEDFGVARVLKKPNFSRPPQSVIDSKLQTFKKIINDPSRKGEISAAQDSLWQYQYLNSMPLLIDSLVTESLKGGELLSKDTLNKVSYLGTLVIKFNQKEDRKYASSSGRFGIEKTQNSILQIFSPFEVYENGYFDNSGNLLVEGYWAWSEKVSTMLPLDYKQHKKQ